MSHLLKYSVLFVRSFDIIICFLVAMCATTTSLQWSRTAVLCLYRSMLRKGETLQFTDSKFYLSRIKEEFMLNRCVESDVEKLRLLRVNNKSFIYINFINIQKVLRRIALKISSR